MLNKKLYRDILKNKSQFITIFLMVLIGVMVYVGISGELYSDEGIITRWVKKYEKGKGWIVLEQA